MGKRLFLVGLLAASLACSGTRKKDQQSQMAAGARASAQLLGRDATERALYGLGIEGRILRMDLNEGRTKKERVKIAQAHLGSDLVLLETGDAQPRLFSLSRNGLDARWVSNLLEPTKFPVAENDDMVVLVSAHYAHALERMSGRRALQFVGGELDGLRRPPLELPFTPTGGAAVGIDTFYIPSLGSPEHNKTMESFIGVTGQRGWGYRTSGDVLTTPVVAGERGDPKLYFVTTTGLVTCMDAANYGYAPRATRWEQLLEAGVDQALHVTRDTRFRPGGVYVVDEEGVVYCLNRITGERLWVNATGMIPAGSPLVFGDVCVLRMKSGLMAFDAYNVVYDLRVVSGPDAGKVFTARGAQTRTLGSGQGADMGLGDKGVSEIHMSFEIQGEVLLVNAPEEEATFRIDGGAPTTRGVLHGGSRIQVGSTILSVVDRGSQPLWVDLDYDTVVGRVGDKLLARKGNSLSVLHARTGEVLNGPVEIPGMRLMPANTTDANLFLVGGDATLYALFPR